MVTGLGLPRVLESLSNVPFQRSITPSTLLKNKHDPRNHTKPHEMDALIRILSCDFVDCFTASIAAYYFFSSMLEVKWRIFCET